MKSFSTLLLFFFVFGAFAQLSTPTADSLNRRAIEIRTYDPKNSLKLATMAFHKSEAIRDTSTMAFSLKNMGVAMYFGSQFDSAAIVLKQSYTLYCLLNDSIGMSASALNLGNCYKQTASIGLSEKYYRISLGIDHALKDTAGMALGLNNLAQLYQFRGQYAEALEIYKTSAQYNLQSGNDFGAGQAWINTGVAYQEQHNYTESSKFFFKALTVFEEYDDPMHIAIVKMNIGENFRCNKQFDQAAVQLKSAMALCEQHENLNELATSYLYYSYLLDDIEKSDSAEYYFFESMDICVATDNDFLASHALMQRGKVLSEAHKYEESNEYLLNAYDFALNLDYNTNISTILNLLSDNYAALGDYNNAWKYQKLASENSLKLMEGVRNEEPETVKDNSAASSKDDTSNSNILITGVLGGIALVLLFLTIGMYFKMNSSKKKS